MQYLLQVKTPHSNFPPPEAMSGTLDERRVYTSAANHGHRLRLGRSGIHLMYSGGFRFRKVWSLTLSWLADGSQTEACPLQCGLLTQSQNHSNNAS